MDWDTYQQSSRGVFIFRVALFSPRGKRYLLLQKIFDRKVEVQ
jgi:hypothetical protein